MRLMTFASRVRGMGRKALLRLEFRLQGKDSILL